MGVLGYFVVRGRAGFYGFVQEDEVNPEGELYERIKINLKPEGKASGFGAQKITNMGQVTAKWETYTAVDMRDIWRDHEEGWSLQEALQAIKMAEVVQIGTDTDEGNTKDCNNNRQGESKGKATPGNKLKEDSNNQGRPKRWATKNQRN